jgi:hypothetical protein
MDALADGFYWCSHDTGMALADGERYTEEWHVVHIVSGEVWMAGADVGLRVSLLPDYVRMVGPLSPPGKVLAPSEVVESGLYWGIEDDGTVEPVRVYFHCDLARVEAIGTEVDCRVGYYVGYIGPERAPQLVATKLVK